jgi:hypothetical protein
MRRGMRGAIAGVLLLLPCLASADGAWLAEEPDGGVGTKGLACDIGAAADGRLHASYWANGYLCYALGRPRAWTIERVASLTDLEDHWSDIEVGPDGAPQIVYYDHGFGGIRYAYRAVEGWQTEPLQPGRAAEQPYSGVYHPQQLVVTSDGTPHVPYLDSAGLHHAWRENGQWLSELVRAKGRSNWPANAAIFAMANDELHIVYTIYQSFPPGISSVMHARWSGGVWHSVEIPRVDMYTLPCFGLDSVARLHGAYKRHAQTDDPTTGMWGQWEDDAGWHTGPIDLRQGLGIYCSLEIDSADSPHIAYYNYRQRALQYGWYDGTFWRLATADSDGEVGEYCSLVLVDDWPYIAHYDETHQALKLTWQDGNGWHDDWIDLGGDLADYASISVGADGFPIIAYDDARARDLRFAWRDEDGWHSEIVDTEHWEGRYPCVRQTPSGEPAIAYMDYTDFALKYAVRRDGRWEIQVVDDDGYCGFHPCLLFGSDGRPRISYCEYPSGPMGRAKLKYARQDADGWHIRYVDSQLDPVAWADGPAPVMVLGLNGYPWILYQAGTLKIAFQTEDGWGINTFDAVAAGRLGLAFDGEWTGYISYADAEGRVTCEQVSGYGAPAKLDTPLVGYDTSLALDGDGRVHIVADDQYGVFDGEAWETELLPAPAKSFALDAAGSPHIAFREWVEELGVNTLGYAHKARRMSMPAGRIDRGWNWISIPEPPLAPDAGAIFGFENVRNKLYRWDPVAKTIETYPDDFSELEVGRAYVLWSDGDLAPVYYAGAGDASREVALPSAGWTWIGLPGVEDVPLVNCRVRNEATGESRPVPDDIAAGRDAWVNWNLVWWDPEWDTARILGLSGADDDALRAWYGYRIWSNVPDLTLIIGR